MKKLLALLVFIALTKPSISQNSFSFNCRIDTTIDCITSCITLKATIPDIFSSTNSYTVNKFSNAGCFRGYIPPNTPGPSANLTIDDRYSPLINITFPFSFFGSTYTKLTASTNGFLTFDTTKALTFSHYGILANGALLSSTTGTPQDIPSALYDAAIIMGPYHDLDPNNATTTQQIKYDVIGTSPYRKWIISYYNVPLYTTACLNLATNTHQIVLYETLGIVEIFIYDKEICTNWNNGRAMIGMQSMNKSSGIMAPGRQATSTPWGNSGMNESWRFVPASGSSLFKRVELYTLSGSFITAGSTTSIGNNLLDVSFGNRCPPSGGDTYVMRSFYRDPNNAANEIVATDTINVSRGEKVTATIAHAGCSANTTGVITITSPVGPVYEYSINGINWQASNIFPAAAGTYTIRVRMVGTNCVSAENFTINNTSLTASIVTVPTKCVGPPTGSIIISPANGNPAFQYSIDSGATFQNSNVFTNLAAGTYNVVVRDASGCTYSHIAIVGTEGPSFSVAVVNPVCGGSTTGSITVSATGIPPFTYSINTGPPQTSNVFNNLTAGTYTIFVNDASACPSALNVVVSTDVLIVANATTKLPTCFGGNDGNITVNPTLGNPPYQYSLNTSPYQSTNVFNNLASGDYTLRIKDAIGCIKDTLVKVLEPNGVKFTTITTTAATCSSIDGQITIKANGGTTPYLYSLHSGFTYSANNIFIVKSGTYSILVKDSKGCTTTGSVTVAAITNDMVLDLGPDKDLCSGSSVSLVPVSNPPADFYRWAPATRLSDSTSRALLVNPTDTITYFLRAKSGDCERNDSITINVLHKPIANAGSDTTICYLTPATLNGSATNLSGTVNYLWMPSNDLTTPNAATTLAWPKDIRTHTYRLQVSDNYGCNFKVYDDVKVSMNGPVLAFAGNDTIAATGIPHQLLGSGGIEYVWSPSNLLNNPLIANPVATLQNDTRFSLLVRDNLGCIGTSTVLIKVYNGPAYYIPNAFTPNNDGLNDVFKAIAPAIQKTFYFRVFNRWGQMMFETKDIRQGWNGTYKGNPQPTAVYVWIIKGLDKFGKTIELKGTVTLIR